MESESKTQYTQRTLYYDELLMLKRNIPNAISSLRLLVLPHLVYSFNQQITLVTYALFLFILGTDFADGYIARKINSTSKLGAYLDFSFDFIFISGMYLNFIFNEIYSLWILVIIIVVFSQFILSNRILKKTIYDPVGKYYGSILFAGIGLTILFPYQLVYNIVSLGIIVSTLISILSRATYFLRIIGRNKK